MATRLQLISELSSSTYKKLSDYENWTAFLHSAAWQYKYPFPDQLMIYAQRPDARACASLDVWNNKLHRWINRGAKGIALPHSKDGRTYIDYVFKIRHKYYIIYYMVLQDFKTKIVKSNKKIPSNYPS